MADPILVPPVATINQGDSPEEIERVGKNVQEIFDKVTKHKPVPEPVKAPEAAKSPEPATVEPAPKETVAPDREQIDTRVVVPKLPSFIEEALSAEPVKTEETPPAATPEPVLEEWPEELPQEEKKSRIKGLRDAYKNLKEENKVLKERPTGVDPEIQQKLEFLENQNKEYQTALSRTTVEHHQEFQNKIIRPLNAAWNEAARIVHETGGDPQELAKALALSGKAQYEALDTVLEGMPESAKIEVNNAVAAYRRSDAARRAWLADAPKMEAELKKSDLQKQYQAISQQKEEMKGMFDLAIRKLREEAKVEVLQKSTDPDAKWWNDQADAIEGTARNVFLENTDMQKVAYACALAPMADVYRKLWMAERAARVKSDQIIKQKFGSEPNMSESGGNQRNGISTPEEELKKPFKDVFLKKFHEERARGVR